MSGEKLNSTRRSWFAVWRWPWWTWFIFVPLVLIAYPLSLGPAVWLSRLGYLPSWTDGPIYVAYRPLTLAVTQIEPAEIILSDYLRWWNELAEQQADSAIQPEMDAAGFPGIAQ